MSSLARQAEATDRAVNKTGKPVLGAGYGWIIDKDHITDDLGSVDHPARNDVGTIGPHNILPSIQNQLIATTNGMKFRMLDDDGELYYEGRLIFHPKYDAPDMQFEPLDDFGMPNAGCTEIQYKSDPEINHTGQEWETL